jgi:hypothetical protein
MAPTDGEGGLAHVIVGPAREAPNTVGLSDPAGQHDHRQVGIDSGGKPIRGTHAVEQLQAAAVLQREVEHDKAGPSHLNRANTLAGSTQP